MGFLAILVGLGVVVLVITGFIMYWLFMAMLIVLGVVFVFWAVVFAMIFGNPIIGGLCSVVATALTFWAVNAYGNKKKTRTNA